VLLGLLFAFEGAGLLSLAVLRPMVCEDFRLFFGERTGFFFAMSDILCRQ